MSCASERKSCGLLGVMSSSTAKNCPTFKWPHNCRGTRDRQAQAQQTQPAVRQLAHGLEGGWLLGVIRSSTARDWPTFTTASCTGRSRVHATHVSATRCSHRDSCGLSEFISSWTAKFSQAAAAGPCRPWTPFLLPQPTPAQLPKSHTHTLHGLLESLLAPQWLLWQAHSALGQHHQCHQNTCLSLLCILRLSSCTHQQSGTN